MRVFIGSIIIMVAFVAGCSDSNNQIAHAGEKPPQAQNNTDKPLRTYDYEHSVQISSKNQPGRRWAVAILRFGDTGTVEDQPFGAETQPADTTGSDVNVHIEIANNNSSQQPLEDPPQLNKRGREVLKHTLMKSDAFVVIERERILDILREINFSKSHYVNPDTTGEIGSIYSVRYIIEGSIGLNEDPTLKGNLAEDPSYKDIPSYHPGLFENIFGRSANTRLYEMQKLQAQRAKTKARATYDCACYLSVYDVYTGEVVATVVGIGRNGLESIEDAVDELVSEMAQINPVISIAAVDADKKMVYLDIGERGGVEVGHRYQVIHRGEPIHDQQGLIIGYEESEAGEVEIVEVRPLLSVAKVILKSSDIQRGDILHPAQH